MSSGCDLYCLTPFALDHRQSFKRRQQVLHFLVPHFFLGSSILVLRKKRKYFRKREWRGSMYAKEDDTFPSPRSFLGGQCSTVCSRFVWPRGTGSPEQWSQAVHMPHTPNARPHKNALTGQRAAEVKLC